MSRKKKDPNLLETVKTFVQNGRYHITEHASLRMKERHVILPEVLHVLQSGWHERKKDTYNEKFQDWDYAIRSQPRDERSLRIAVAIDELTMLVIITVIDLNS